MIDLLSVSTQEGDFKAVENLKGGPVPPEEVIRNIRESSKLDIPLFEKMPKREGSMVFVAGGTTLMDYLDEIRERRNNGECIVTSNKTYDYLVENDIVANICVMVDPKEMCKGYITKPHKDTLFLIGVVCNPEVYNNLLKENMNVLKLLVGYGLEDESDLNLQKELYPGQNAYLVGGTMMGLRAMNLAPLLGFRKIEYYGFDSCFSSKQPDFISSDDPRYEEVKKENGGMYYEDPETGKFYTIDDKNGGFFYAYKKKRSENIMIAKTSDGRKFATSPCFAHQAKQFIKWLDRVEGKTEIVVHGDSLSSHILKCYRDAQEKMKAEIGDKRWTDEYEKIQKEMHGNVRYGMSGTNFGGRDRDTELLGRGVLGLYHNIGKRNLTFLDYGCGQGELTDSISAIFKILESYKYDPFIDKYNKIEYEKYDVVGCYDVMEHVESQCIDNVLKHMALLTKYMLILRIAIVPAHKKLPDGRNAHITQKHPEWWFKKIANHFVIAEGIYVGDYAYFVCQSFNADDEISKETINLGASFIKENIPDVKNNGSGS